MVKCSRDVNIKPDILISEAKVPYDIIVLPGGLGGSQSMARSKSVGDLLKQQESEGRWIAAICAGKTFKGVSCSCRFLHIGCDFQPPQY